jgi:hypothetical protein
VLAVLPLKFSSSYPRLDEEGLPGPFSARQRIYVCNLEARGDDKHCSLYRRQAHFIWL